MGAQYPKSIPAADDLFTSRLTCTSPSYTYTNSGSAAVKYPVVTQTIPESLSDL